MRTMFKSRASPYVMKSSVEDAEIIKYLLFLCDLPQTSLAHDDKLEHMEQDQRSNGARDLEIDAVKQTQFLSVLSLLCCSF